MRLRDIMSEQVETVAPGATVEEAKERMRREDVRHLVVVEAGRIAGVVSAHDLQRAQDEDPVREVMSAPARTATPQTTLRQAANLLRGHHLSCLPVLDVRGALSGIVTVSDLLDLIGKGVTRAPAAEIKRPRAFVPGR